MSHEHKNRRVDWNSGSLGTIDRRSRRTATRSAGIACAVGVRVERRVLWWCRPWLVCKRIGGSHTAPRRWIESDLPEWDYQRGGRQGADSRDWGDFHILTWMVRIDKMSTQIKDSVSTGDTTILRNVPTWRTIHLRGCRDRLHRCQSALDAGVALSLVRIETARSTKTWRDSITWTECNADKGSNPYP